MKATNISALAAAVFASLLGLAGGPPAYGFSGHVDLGYSGGSVGPAAGYVLLTNANCYSSGTQVSVGSSVTAGYVHTVTSAWGYRDRSGASVLLRDFVLISPYGHTVYDPIQVRGLAPGNYTLTLYANDYWYTHTSCFDIDQNNDGAADQTVTIDSSVAIQASVNVTVSSAGILQIGLWSPNSGVCNGFDLANATQDTTPPSAVGDLTVTATTSATASLSWTVPTDDSGQAASYDIRYSTTQITDANWASASQAAGEPVAGVPGTQQTFTVTGLAASTQYFFAIKSADGTGNVSALSNVPDGTTQAPDTTPSAAVVDLSVIGTTSSSVSLRWTAPADDSGQVVSYDIRYSTSTITAANFAAAPQAIGAPTPAAPGTQENVTVSGLNSNTTYYFAVKSADPASNISAISNVPSGRTLVASNVPVARLDFQPSAAGVTAPGYIAIGPTYRWDAGLQADLGNGIKGAWTTAYTADFRDRGTSDPLLRDFFLWSPGQTGDAFQIRGLRAGNYDLKFYSVDTGYSNDFRTSFAIDGNNDGVADTTMTIQNGLGETSKTASVAVGSVGILSIKFAPIDTYYGACNGFDLISTTPDTTPPAAITTLAAANVQPRQLTLQWTAPADDNGTWGKASSYDVRQSASPITEANWDSAIPLPGASAPSPAGQLDSMVVTGLTGGTTYYFAVKSTDNAGNTSPLSNVLQVTTDPPDVTPPAAVTNLAASQVGPNWVQLTWSATGDDGMTGQADHYELRYSTAAITEANWAGATPVVGLAAPKVSGSAETFRVHGLLATTTYYFAIKVIDEWPNTSGLSNVPSAATLQADTSAPDPVADLRVAAMHIKTAYLVWTVPTDVGAAGVGSYDVRVSTSPINNANFGSATQAQNVSTPGAPGQADRITVAGLQPDTVYYFAVKVADQAEPANVSAISNTDSGKTLPPVAPLIVRNPWITNDRVADCRTLQTMATTFGNAFTPDGTVPGTTDQGKIINEYNNLKRRIYHWGDDPPTRTDNVLNLNVFGHSLCGGQAALNANVLTAMGYHTRVGSIANGAHTVYEVYYNNDWHLLDTMTTMYVLDRATPPMIASASRIAADKTLLTSAVAEGRACPGFLLCPDDPVWWANGCSNWDIMGDPGTQPVTWSMNMNLHMGEIFNRSWESWLNQHTTPRIDADNLPGIPDPPYHHDGKNDWKDYVNFPYWEPYALNQAQNNALNIGYTVTHRRWANGTYDIAPDFRNTGYTAALAGSANIATYATDGKTPDLHPATTGALASVVYRVQLPFFITDCNISGTFTRATGGDINNIYVGTSNPPGSLVWTNSTTGTTQLNNLNLRNYVFGLYDFYVKVELKAAGQITDAGVANLVISTTYEHSQPSMAYLDKGVNNVTVTFDNPQDLTASTCFKVTYKWKEFDGTDWTVDRINEQYVTSSPYTFSITTGGTKVPRTECIRMEVIPAPLPDTMEPAPLSDLTATNATATKVTLNWTASGDDGNTGQAAGYDIRSASSPITEANWSTATPLANQPTPQLPGTAEHLIVTGLQPLTTYYFAMKVRDEGGNLSQLSNVVSLTTTAPDLIPPDWVGNLVATPSTLGGAVSLAWTAPADYGAGGAGPYACASYELRYSTSPILYGDESTWITATPVSGLPTPKGPGVAESFVVAGLTGNTQYYFAIRCRDDSGNLSEVSNTATTAPAVLGDKVLQYGLNSYNGCRDNYVEQGNPTSKYGAYERMRVAAYADLGDIERGFVKFDLTGIPAGMTIRRATLSLYSYDTAKMQGSAGSYGLYRLTRTWDELNSCYNQANAGVNWTTPGGDFEAIPDATAPKNAPKVPIWYNWDVTSRVQAWINNPSGNFGWCVRGTVETTHCQDQFYQSDTANASFRPKLVISDLSPPVPGDVSGDGTVDVVDLLYFVDSFGAICGTDRNYDPRCDFNADKSVDVIDLLTFVQDYWPQ